MSVLDFENKTNNTLEPTKERFFTIDVLEYVINSLKDKDSMKLPLTFNVDVKFHKVKENGGNTYFFELYNRLSYDNSFIMYSERFDTLHELFQELKTKTNELEK